MQLYDPLKLSFHSPLVSVPPFRFLYCFKSDFNDEKSKVGLFKKKIKTSYCAVHHPLYPYPFLSVYLVGFSGAKACLGIKMLH